jgi:hypothetical protein
MGISSNASEWDPWELGDNYNIYVGKKRVNNLEERLENIEGLIKDGKAEILIEKVYPGG